MQQNEENEKLSLGALREMWRNSVRLSRMVFRVRPWLVIGIFTLFALAAGLTYASSGLRALLINDLIGSAGSGVWSYSIIFLFGAVILARLLPDLVWQLRDYWNWIVWFLMEEQFNVLVLHKRSELDVAIHEDPKYQNLFQRVNDSGVW